MPFWRHGVLRDAFGPMDAKTEACVGPVGSILEPLGGLWAALGHPLSSLWGALASICDPLLPKIAPTWSKNRSKIDQNKHFESASVFSSIFCSIWAPKLDATNPKFIEKLLGFTIFRRLQRFRVQIRFGLDLGIQNGPFWHQNWSKIHLWGVLGGVFGRVWRVLRARGACKCRSGAFCAPQAPKNEQP